MLEEAKNDLEKEKIIKNWILKESKEILKKTNNFIIWKSLVLFIQTAVYILLAYFLIGIITDALSAFEKVKSINWQSWKVGLPIVSLIYLVALITTIVYLVKSNFRCKNFVEDCRYRIKSDSSSIRIYVRKASTLKTSLVAELIITIGFFLFFIFGLIGLSIIVFLIDIGVFIWVCVNYFAIKKELDNYIS